jgi:2-haloacid dehalogenase
MDVSRFQVVTFDCYGTLIDWETGILSAVRPVLASHGVSATDDEIICEYAALERRIEAGPYMKYRDVLRAVIAGLGERFGCAPTRAECDAFAASVTWWPAFEDTVGALRSLQSRVKVAIISNVDEDLFAGTKKRLGLEPDFVITAERCRSYKPSRNNFETALRVLAEAGIPKDCVLHAAESVYHDIEPAKAMGIATVWVNRRGSRGPGASGAGDAHADLEVRDLKTLGTLVLGAP